MVGLLRMYRRLFISSRRISFVAFWRFIILFVFIMSFGKGLSD